MVTVRPIFSISSFLDTTFLQSSQLCGPQNCELSVVFVLYCTISGSYSSTNHSSKIIPSSMDFINNAILVHELQISLCYAKEAFSERTVLLFAHCHNVSIGRRLLPSLPAFTGSPNLKKYSFIYLSTVVLFVCFSSIYQSGSSSLQSLSP